ETFVNHPSTGVSYAERNSLLQEITDKQVADIDISNVTIASCIFPRFVKSLSTLSVLIPTLIQLLDNLLTAISAQDRIRQIDSNLIIETKKVLHQLKQGIEHIAPTSIAFQIGLIRKAITPINSAIEGDPLNGLQIMGLLES